MTNTKQLTNQELLSEWAFQFTDEMINKNLIPHLNDLLNDKGFITLLRLWKKERDLYEQFRKYDVKNFIENKIEFPELSKELKLKSYSNEVFEYSNILLTIVMHYGE